jgi:hypothetical protein
MNTETQAQDTATYSTVFTRRSPSGVPLELGRIRASLARDATPAAIEAVAAKAARRQGVNVAMATERQTFRLRAVDPRTGAESWVALSRSGGNEGCGFDSHE